MLDTFRIIVMCHVYIYWHSKDHGPAREKKGKGQRTLASEVSADSCFSGCDRNAMEVHFCCLNVNAKRRDSKSRGRASKLARKVIPWLIAVTFL